jgi:hypothetical protein
MLQLLNVASLLQVLQSEDTTIAKLDRFTASATELGNKGTERHALPEVFVLSANRNLGFLGGDTTISVGGAVGDRVGSAVFFVGAGHCPTVLCKQRTSTIKWRDVMCSLARKRKLYLEESN